VLVTAGVAIGHYFRPAPPPLIIERSPNSRLSDSSIDLTSDSSVTPKVAVGTDDAVYICGARTQKGAPCRRRVHAAGERCYQHKGKPAMLPIEKLIVKDV
jgi:hypothetical protein